MGNAKLLAAEDFLAAKLERANGSRALIFADDRKLCMEAGMHLATTMAGTHVVALNDAIYFLRGGKQLDKLTRPLDTGLLEKLVKDDLQRSKIMAETGGISVHKLPFHKRALKLHPMDALREE